MDQEEAPPPYSAVDPLLAPGNSRNNGSASAPLPETVSIAQDASSSSAVRPVTASNPAIVPTHFTSAVTYFEERPPTVVDDSRDLLHHHMTIYPRSSAKDFPRRPRCWTSQVDEVAQQDWDTFLRYLFPPQLGLAAASQHLPRQLRAEIQRDRKDRPQETDEQRQARIAAVVDEWNTCFFEPRAARIDFVYVGESDAAPSSALCPHCYPAATRATQSPSATGSLDGHHASNLNAPSPMTGQHTPSPTGWPVPPNQHYPYPPQPGHFGPFGAFPPFPVHGAPPNHQPPQYYPPPPPPPPGVPPWQWNYWAYTQPQFGNSGTQKSGGALGWISSLTSQAQKYGERFAEQAQHYGDQISSQAMHYGRQVEEQALAHGRWIEEQARLHGRKQGAYPSAPYTSQQSPWTSGQTSGTTPSTPTPPNQSESVTQPSNQTPTQDPNQNTESTRNRDEPNNQGKADSKDPITDRSRRASISSISSDSSFSSIDSLSTTSDLDPSDLATVRTQLQNLHDRHDRTLYEAAVDLRQQLDVLRDSRREARASGRQNWRNGWRRQQPNRVDSSDWGRWESPEQQERQTAERRAMRDEMRHTKQAFRDVVRRARNEQRERRRAKRNRRRQALASAEKTANDKGSLEGRMGNLALGDTPNPRPVRAQTEPVSSHLPRSLHVRSNAGSDVGAHGTGNAASSASQSNVNEFPTELPERKPKPQGRLKEMLKPRSAKKQQKPDSESKDVKDPK